MKLKTLTFLLIFLSLPAAILLFAFRTSIVQMLFQTGAFSAQSTALVAAPLAYLAAGLVSYALVEALTRAFYAMHDTRTPVLAGVAIIVINIALGAALLDRMGLVALALALSVSTTIEAIILGAVLTRRVGAPSRTATAWLARVLGATALTAAAAAALAGPVAEATLPGNAPRLLQIAVLCVALGVVGVVYLGCAWILNIPELTTSFDRMASRLPLLRRFLTAAERRSTPSAPQQETPQEATDDSRLYSGVDARQIDEVSE